MRIKRPLAGCSQERARTSSTSIACRDCWRETRKSTNSRKGDLANFLLKTETKHPTVRRSQKTIRARSASKASPTHRHTRSRGLASSRALAREAILPTHKTLKIFSLGRIGSLLPGRLCGPFSGEFFELFGGVRTLKSHFYNIWF